MTRDKAKLVGVNHVALEVGEIDDAVDFYRTIFEFELRGETETMAFFDMGDQFLALGEHEGERTRDGHRHFGLVVDDRDKVRRAVEQSSRAELLETGGLDFLDPWGNRIQIVEYSAIQFTKSESVLRGMGLGDLEKTEDAKEQLMKKGLLGAPPEKMD